MFFQENQRFNNKWHYILFGIIICLSLATSSINYFSSGHTTLSLIASICSLIFITTLWFSMKLKTSIDKEGIHYKYSPFHLRKRVLSWNDIQSVEVKDYSPFGDYGGWGIRFKGFDFNDLLLNVAGKKGIYVVLKSGKKIMIGTQLPKEAEQALKQFKTIT